MEKIRSANRTGREGYLRRIALKAGQLSADFEPESGALRTIRSGGREVLRGIHGAVRDCKWRFVPPRIEDLRLIQNREGFEISFRAFCRNDDLDYSWLGIIKASAAGTLHYAFEGLAASSFRRNRIGLCILHPMELAGQACTVETVDGDALYGHFPDDLAAHQPFLDMASISHEVAPGLIACVRFQGETFEMEDQRNWTDASFKTYGTPLALPFPVRVRQGDRVSQSVDLVVLGTALPLSQPAPRDRVSVGIGKPVRRLPAIGFDAGRECLPQDRHLLQRLSALGAASLRIDLSLEEPGAFDRLGATAVEARKLGTNLEIALHLGHEPEVDLDRLATFLATHAVPVCRWLILSQGAVSTPDDLLETARRRLGHAVESAEFGVGTDRYFTQLNRGKPRTEGADFISYSLNPQVHSFDNSSVMETLSGQPLTMRDALSLGGGLPVRVSPVTLRPRTGPQSSDASDGADTRLSTLFAAAWTLGTVAGLVHAGAAGLTLHQIAGPDSILTGPDGKAPPLWRLLAALAEYKDALFVQSYISDSSAVACLALETGAGVSHFLANLTPDALCVELEPGGRARRFTVDLLDDRGPSGSCDAGKGTIELTDGPLDLALGPYAIAHVRTCPE